MKTITVYRNKEGKIYLIDNTIELEENEEHDFIMEWEKSNFLFNALKSYQEKGYTIIFN